MKIFNTVMTTMALVTLLMASASKVDAGTPSPEEIEKGTTSVSGPRTAPACEPSKPQYITVCTQPVCVLKPCWAGPTRGFANPSAEDEKKYMQHQPSHAQQQRERAHNSQSFGYDLPNYGLAQKAWLDPKGDLTIKAAFEYVFHGKSELFDILNLQAHHFPAIEVISGKVSLKEELEAAVDQCKRLKAFSRPGDPL